MLGLQVKIVLQGKKRQVAYQIHNPRDTGSLSVDNVDHRLVITVKVAGNNNGIFLPLAKQYLCLAEIAVDGFASSPETICGQRPLQTPMYLR